MRTLNYRQIPNAIANHDNFQGNSMSGTRGGHFSFGMLSRDEADKYVADRNAGITYTLVSYDTPIAWTGVNGTYIVSDYFSVTTSRQQHLARTYLK